MPGPPDSPVRQLARPTPDVQTKGGPCSERSGWPQIEASARTRPPGPGEPTTWAAIQLPAACRDSGGSGRPARRWARRSSPRRPASTRRRHRSDRPRRIISPSLSLQAEDSQRRRVGPGRRLVHLWRRPTAAATTRVNQVSTPSAMPGRRVRETDPFQRKAAAPAVNAGSSVVVRRTARGSAGALAGHQHASVSSAFASSPSRPADAVRRDVGPITSCAHGRRSRLATFRSPTPSASSLRRFTRQAGGDGGVQQPAWPVRAAAGSRHYPRFPGSARGRCPRRLASATQP
jgi:hypothetical protein